MILTGVLPIADVIILTMYTEKDHHLLRQYNHLSEPNVVKNYHKQDQRVIIRIEHREAIMYHRFLGMLSSRFDMAS